MALEALHEFLWTREGRKMAPENRGIGRGAENFGAGSCCHGTKSSGPPVEAQTRDRLARPCAFSVLQFGSDTVRGHQQSPGRQIGPGRSALPTSCEGSQHVAPQLPCPMSFSQK